MLIDISTTELLNLWGDLLEAYHGVSGFGGDTTEIYAYRLGSKQETETLSSDHKNSLISARNNLLELLELFQESYNCEFEINGDKTIKDIRKRWVGSGDGFKWRIAIKVIKQDANQKESAEVKRK